jgi:hypothetical protein
MGEVCMEKKTTVSVTLELDEKWASAQSKEGLTDYLKSRLNGSLGFRGHVKRFRIVSR